MTTGRIPPPPPGIYYGISEAVYRSWDAVNWSCLKTIAKTPRHYRHASMAEPSESSDAQEQGTLFHSLLLEPDAAKTRYIVAPREYPSEISTGRGDNKVIETVEKPWNMNATFCKDWAALQNAEGRVICKTYDLQAARAMVASVMEIPDAVVFLKGSQTEVSIVWDDPQTGLRCKARLDIVNHGQLGDVKSSAKSLAWEEFARTVKYWGYAGQMAFYRDGLNAAMTGAGQPLPKVPMARFICAETEPPYSAAVYDLYDVPGSVSHDWFAYGRGLYRDYLRQVADCISSGHYPTWNQTDPSKPPEAMELAVPDYVRLDAPAPVYKSADDQLDAVFGKGEANDNK